MFCTNFGFVPAKFYIPDRLKQSKISDDEHTKPLDSPNVPIIFTPMQNFFLSVLSKRVYPVPLRMLNKSAQRKLAKHKKTSRGKFQSEAWLLSLKSTTWKQRRDIIAPEKGLHLTKNIIILPVISSLTSCLGMEQFVLVPASVHNKSLITQSVTKQELSKYQPSQNPTYQVDSLKKEVNKKILQSRFLSRQNCPRIRLSNSKNFNFG